MFDALLALREEGFSDVERQASADRIDWMPSINDAAEISWTGGSLVLMLCAVETGARRWAPMTDDLKELLDDTHFAAMAHAVAADTDDDGGTSAVVEFLERRAADQEDLDRRALVDRFRERIETAQRVDPTYGAYDDLPAADHVA